MEFDNQRTSVIYVLNIVFTTLILGLQLASTSVLVAEYRSADMFRIEFMSSILAVLCEFFDYITKKVTATNSPSHSL